MTPSTPRVELGLRPSGVLSSRWWFGEAAREVRCGECALIRRRDGLQMAYLVGVLLADETSVGSFMRQCRSGSVRREDSDGPHWKKDHTLTRITCRRGHTLDCAMPVLVELWRLAEAMGSNVLYLKAAQ